MNFFGGNNCGCGGNTCDLLWLIILLSCLCGSKNDCGGCNNNCGHDNCGCGCGIDICSLIILLMVCGGGFGGKCCR